MRSVVDACRHVVRQARIAVPLATRPVLFALARSLAEAWPADVAAPWSHRARFPRADADGSHRARLRVEIGRFREKLLAVAG